MKTVRIIFVLTIAFFFTVPAYAQKVPESYKTEFLEKYRFFIDKDTKKSFEKLTTDEERDAFIENFWKERDTDPNTPENEYKDQIDERFIDIEDEIFATDPDITGVIFRSEGGVNGDMARVYLLHGEPDLKVKKFQGRSHVDLMLWLYADESGQYPKYMFLFYRKHDVGHLQVFRNYSMSLIWSLVEVSRFGEQGVEDTYKELLYMDGQDGQLMLYALSQFSYDSSIHVDEAMDPPKPASLLAKQSRGKVVGQPNIAKELNIIYSKENSFIPANFEVITTSTLESPETKSVGVSLGIRYGDLDWLAQDDGGLGCALTLTAFIQNRKTREVSFYSWNINLKIPKTRLDNDPKLYKSIPLEEFVKVLEKLSPGSYKMELYLKNTLTNKYNAWSENFVK